MDLSEWFRTQLQSSNDAVVWAVGQVPDEHREFAPPPRFGEWSVARHIFRLLYYEREAALPHMQHWFDESDLTQAFTHYKEEETWKNSFDMFHVQRSWAFSRLMFHVKHGPNLSRCCT